MVVRANNVIKGRFGKPRAKGTSKKIVRKRSEDYDSHNFADVYAEARTELHDWAKSYLAERGVSLATAKAAGLRSTLDGPFGRALCIPYFTRDGKVDPCFGRWRNFDVEEPKFYQQPETAPQLYMPPIGVKWASVLANVKREVEITEGEIKTLAALQNKITVVGLGGIWNFRRAIRDDKGKKTGDRALLDEFGWFEWHGRRVVLIPDSDADEKPLVALAVIQLGAVLQRKDADVRVMPLPVLGDLKKVGLDDYIVRTGSAHLASMLVEAPSLDDPRFHRWGLPAERYRYTDNAVAEQFVLDHGHRFRFVHTWNSWYRYEGSRWHADSMKQCEEAVIETAHRLQHEVKKIKNEKERATAFKEACRLEEQRRVRSVLERARTKPLLGSVPDQWDADPNLLGVANGAVDLNTGRLLPPDPNRLITRYSPVAYDPKAPAATEFLKFMREIMCGDDGRVAYLQRVLGYALTGHTSEQCMFVLHGYGDNGKSTMLGVLQPILGRYMMSSRADSLMMRDRYGGNSANSDIARLRGSRLVTAVETNVGQHLDESLIKSLTGQDVITARFLNQEWFEFRPQFKLMLLCNFLPKVRGGDHAIRRRMRLIPFEFKVKKKQKDKHVALLKERAGILRWLVEGAMAWYRQGLNEPSAITAATTEYLDAHDPVRQFIADRCEKDAAAYTKRTQLYDQYKFWIQGHPSQIVPTAHQFYEMLKERGYQCKVRRGVEHFYGIKLKVRREEVE